MIFERSWKSWSLEIFIPQLYLTLRILIFLVIFWQKYEISTSKILDFAKYNKHKNSNFFQGKNNSFCKFSVHCENKTKNSVFRLFDLQYELFGFIEKRFLIS